MQRYALLLLAAVLGSAAMAAPEDDAKALVQALGTLNDAYLKKDVDTIKRLTSEDLVVVSASGQRETREEQLKSLGDLKLGGYKTEAVRITHPAKDVAIVTFQSIVSGTFKGKALPTKMTVVTVWVQRGGQWLEIFYQATALEAK